MTELHVVEMPALDGRLPLGFLAGLGLLSVLGDLEIEARLSWSPVTATAIIHSQLQALDEVAGVLAEHVARADPKAAIAGVLPGFPLGGAFGDPMKKTRQDFRALAEALATADPRASAWLPHLVTDLAVDGKGRGVVSPMTAQDRNEGLAEFFGGPLAAVRKEPDRIREALAGWRRVPETKALMLDYQAMWYAADDPAGQRGQERGVPGAIWLATMSLGLLRLTGSSHSARATLWHQLDARGVMLWPLWRLPLTMQAVQALIEHPAIVLAAQQNGLHGAPAVAVRNGSWRCLGVIGVYAATRIRAEGQKSQRVLTPIPVRATD